MVFRKQFWLALAVSVLTGSAAQASVVVLDFEGLSATYPFTFYQPVFVNNFYNGGTSSTGTSGTNYGVSFSSDARALCLNTTTVKCSNSSRAGQGDPNSQTVGLTFTGQSASYLNVAAGFDTAFSFMYASPSYSSSLSIFDGLDGTGTLLAKLDIPFTSAGPCPGYAAQYCPFVAAGIGFAGTAKSVSFYGFSFGVAFDDVTLGSLTAGGSGPSAVPLPAGFPLLAGGLMLLGALRRKVKGRKLV